MLSFLLRLFAALVFLALAATWLDKNTVQWAYGASSAFVASFLIDGYGPVFPPRQPQA